MYYVTTYEVKTGLFGANMGKVDDEMAAFLNSFEKNGWTLVAMTEMNTSGKSFVYKMVFKK
jgi:hypothetical protein